MADAIGGRNAMLKPGPAPTGRDKIFDALYGAMGGTPDKRWWADKATTAIDWGTLGMLSGAYDGGREIAETGRPGALAMALMPGAKVAGAGAQAATQAAKKGIKAYHGSPHDFDRFDLSKIGTGEGAQAYGHGLYFAENEGVAKSYRDALGSITSATVDGKSIYEAVPDQWARRYLRDFGYDVDSAVAQLRKHGKNDSADVLEKASGANVTPGGRMYEVNIKADPEDFLDWDKPIAEQSEKVRKAFEGANVAPFYNMRGEPVPIEQRRGEAAYHSLAEALGTPFDPARPRMAEKPNPVAATQYLKERGIAGTRYLDGQSRDGGEGTRNLALFDDSLIEILRKYGLLPPAVAGGVAASQSDAQAGQ